MRLTTDLWVSAYLTRLRLADIPVYVTAKGDATAGAVIVKCATLDGQAKAVQRSYDLMTGARVWVTLAEGPEAEVDATLRRQRDRDEARMLLGLGGAVAQALLDEVSASRAESLRLGATSMAQLKENIDACNLDLDEATLEVRGSETRLERITIGANLRHDQLDEQVTETWLQANPPSQTHGLPHGELQALYRLAVHLKQGRELVRGKPEQFNRPDPVFRLENVPDTGPTGEEQVHIGQRRRGAPLDLIVAEAMILANRTWGQWMADLGVPAIYRSQASLSPGIKVRMGTKPLPHAGMGVPCYAWSTSPLRRYSDLVNQWQILACVRQGPTAALVAPFKPKDTDLLAIISAFDSAYSAYNTHQSAMERFWSLKYLQQQSVTQLQAQVVRDFPDEPPMVRAAQLPLVFPLLGAPPLRRGQQVLVRLAHLDELSLDIRAEFVQLMDEAQASDAALEEEELPQPNLVLVMEANEPENPAS